MRAEVEFSSEGRVRDPLEVLPLLPAPSPLSSPSGRSRSRFAQERAIRVRTNAALRSLAALTTNSYHDLRDSSFGSSKEWDTSHELPRRISERVLQCHRDAHDQKMYDSDAESAFERLALHAKPGTYAGFSVSDKDDDDVPQRGKVMPFVSGEASLPPAGTQPCDIRMISPKARYYFDRFHERMCLPPSQVDEADIEKTRAYMDPSLRSRSARLQFALRLWESGMLGFTDICRAEVSVFFVMKKVNEAGQFILRPVWDLRQVNKRFQKPPHLSLGSPMAMAELDLSDEITDGRVLQSTWGDVPDYFHRCKSCSELWPYMVFGGVTIPQLLKELKRQGKGVPAVPKGARYLCLVVMLMGFSWSPAICHGALEDLLCDLPGFPRGAQLVHGRVPPSFSETAFIYWVFMDDFASMTLQQDEMSGVAEAVREHAGKKLKEVGLDMHKDGVGAAMPLSLGVTITQRPHRLMAAQEKVKNVIGATKALLDRGRATPTELSRIIGSWVWLAMCCRAAFCMLDACYKFVTKYGDDDQVHILWESVTNELYMLYHLAPLMYTHLESKWSSSVFATDASEEGLGVVETERVPPMKFMADIFSGYGGFGQAIREELQCQTLFVDNAREVRHDLLDSSFVELVCRAVLRPLFFMVHLVQRVREGNALAQAAISICYACLASGTGFSLENPRTSMIWDLPDMAKLLTMDGVRVVEMVYCAFGARWKKPTRIVTNVQALEELECKCSQDHDHQELRGRDSQGRLWTRLAAVYPPRLCKAYASCVAKAVSNNELKLHDWRMRELRGASPKPVAVMSHWAKVSRWHLAWKGVWAYHDHINVQEMRTVASVSRHLCRSSKNWFSRVLVLCDSMVTVGAVRKMRSSSRPLMTQLKKIGAITLATGIRLTLRWIPTDMNPADGPSRGEEIGSAEITKTKSEQKKSVMDSDFEFERLFGDMLEIRGMHDDYDLDESFQADGDHTFDSEDGQAADDVGMFAGALEAAVTVKKTAKKKGKQRAHVPQNKKGPLAFENAAREPPVSRTSLGSGTLEVPLRLLVHAVQDNTNVCYIKEVEPFLVKVRLKRLPFSTAAERDITLAAELDHMCFVERASVSRGVRLYHGLVHMFPEWKSELPISLRALHSWEKFQESWEGGPASAEAIYFISSQAIKSGHIDEGIAFLVAYDCYLREQDWLQLKGEDLVGSKWHDFLDGDTEVRVSRQVKSKEWQLTARVKQIKPTDKVFNTTAAKATSVWRGIQSKFGLEWIGPMHTLRHSGPSYDILHKRRSIQEVQRRGRWTQAKSMARYAKLHSLIVHDARLPAKIKDAGRRALHDLSSTLESIPTQSPWRSEASRGLTYIAGADAGQAMEPVDPAA
ncbi:unnamed protein product [Prorocentrum cordatum]|uniref:Uncharacterized protein n=1 Tax=Prorocentrum cordatum TaxID=2364126 RepID=A0ABN9S1H9_9DINO|nr:unnamed protein product [Polarella glacialis]